MAASLEDRLANLLRQQPAADALPPKPRQGVDESNDPRIVSNPANGNVFSCCGIHFRMVRCNVIGKATLGTAINPHDLQCILPGAVYDADSVRSVNSWGASPRGLCMVYQRGLITVIGAESYAGMMCRLLHMTLALQSQGYQAKLSDAVVFNMAATIRPINGILPLDLQRFASRPKHAPFATYDPDSIESLRYSMACSTAGLVKAGQITANIFSSGRVVLLGAYEPVVWYIAREVVSLVVTEYIEQYRENASGMYAQPEYVPPNEATEDDLMTKVLKLNGMAWATDPEADVADGIWPAADAGAQTDMLTGNKRAFEQELDEPAVAATDATDLFENHSDAESDVDSFAERSEFGE